MAVVTISREPGVFGEEVAARVAGRLGYTLVDDVRLQQLWTEVDLDEGTLGSVDERLPCDEGKLGDETEAALKLIPEFIVELAEEHDLVVVGRGAQGLFRDRPGTLHVRLVAPRAYRVQQFQERLGLPARQARSRIRTLENQRACYLRFLYRLNWADPHLYDLVLRMDRISVDQAVELIVEHAERMALRKVPRLVLVADLLPEVDEGRGDGRFANEAEAEFARFLEFYHIPYEYEPHTFTLETDAEGRVVEAFTPDFYLPEQDLYIELTTMQQSLVTRKNRKVRKLRRLYPDVHIRIFYQRDFYRLMAKYGLLVDKAAESAPAA